MLEWYGFEDRRQVKAADHWKLFSLTQKVLEK